MPNPETTLASRCEREEPSRELDAEIALAVTGHSRPALPYTASIDAALTLVPKGYAWMAGCNMGDGYFASLAVTEEGGLPSHNVNVENARSPALALCSAALRARAAQEAEGN